MAQSNSYIPDTYNYFSKTIAIINPSYIPEVGSYDFSLYHKFLTGQFSDISYTSFIAAKNLRGNNRDMSFRLVAAREQEGPYISIPKAALSYGYQLKVNTHTHLSAGLSLGAAGVYLSAPSFSNSFLLPDGALGLGLRYKKNYVGASTLQIFDASKPSFALMRYYNVVLNKDIPLGLAWALRQHLFWGIQPIGAHELKYSLLMNFNKKFEFGAVVRSRAGWSGVLNLTIPLDFNQLEISLAYNANFQSKKYYYIPNSLELGVALILQ